MASCSNDVCPERSWPERERERGRVCGLCVSCVRRCHLGYSGGQVNCSGQLAKEGGGGGERGGYVDYV